MAYTQAQLDDLQAAYARGVREVWLANGDRMQFRTLDEMERLIAKIEGDLGINPTHKNVVHPTHSRGF